jgi:hypothetical protein
MRFWFRKRRIIRWKLKKKIKNFVTEICPFTFFQIILIITMFSLGLLCAKVFERLV